MFKKMLSVLFLSLIAIPSHARLFRNAYISFSMPDKWQCQLDGTEWICRSDADKESKEAVIILTAKEAGPTDSLAAYSAHLSGPIVSQGHAGQNITSKVSAPPKEVQINNQIWIDGLHLHGEVANYFTRYLATVKDRIAILVTYSAHKDFFSKYATDFFSSINSMQITASKSLLPEGTGGGQGTIVEPLGGASNPIFSDPGLPPPRSQAGGKNTAMLLTGLALILIGAAIYIFLKLKKK